MAKKKAASKKKAAGKKAPRKKAPPPASRRTRELADSAVDSRLTTRGLGNAPDADKGGVRTRQVPEDDVPQEYLDED